MSKDLSRRKFFEHLAVGGAAGAVILNGLPQVAEAATHSLPHRTLGKTGVSVSILAFGGGSRFGMYNNEEAALSALNKALDWGITYIDTAHEYGQPNGTSEMRIGKVVKARGHKGLFIATKISERSYDGFMRNLETSLKRLQMDRVDLLHIHSLAFDDDLRKIEAPHGTMAALIKAKEQGMCRFIGTTSHTDGATMAKLIEHNPLDCVQMALNGARNGDLEKLALPQARKKNLGVIAMKITGQEMLIGSGPGKTNINNLLEYSVSLPGVTTGVIGMPNVADIQHNTALLRNFSRLNESAMNRIRKQLSASTEPLTKKLQGHLDAYGDHSCWA